MSQLAKNIYKMRSEIHCAKALAWSALGMAAGESLCWLSWVCFAGAIYSIMRAIQMHAMANEVTE